MNLICYKNKNVCWIILYNDIFPLGFYFRNKKKLTWALAKSIFMIKGFDHGKFVDTLDMLKED
jgi:hypothetical protein